jgi:hypothetical protein
MLSYYPPMSGEDDGPIVFPTDHITGHRPPPMGWEFDGSSGFGDEGTQVCDVNNGNLVNCRPYDPPTPHGWEFDGSSGFGGGGHSGGGGGGAPSARPSSPSAIAASPTSRNAATLASAVASVSHPMASPAQRQAAGQSAGYAGSAHQAGSFRAPRTTRGFAERGRPAPPSLPGRPAPPSTRDFTDAQRGSYGDRFDPRGYGYAGYGLAPRPWNDPYYNFGPYDGFYDDQVVYADDVSPDWDSADMDDDPNFNGDFMKEVKTEVSRHKPEVLGASLAAIGGYAAGPIGAAAGGLLGYIGGKVLGL